MTATRPEAEATLGMPRQAIARVSGEAVDAIIAYVHQLDPATQIEVLRRLEETMRGRSRLAVDARTTDRRSPARDDARFGQVAVVTRVQSIANGAPRVATAPPSICYRLARRANLERRSNTPPT